MLELKPKKGAFLYKKTRFLNVNPPYNKNTNGINKHMNASESKKKAIFSYDIFIVPSQLR